ncbi:hypothetical protein C8Q76DRAFT_605297 [Earliella scabrosa]|nr:hypothetical protein C8Q76DRAFT_605297 [Earliella scabrosa]
MLRRFLPSDRELLRIITDCKAIIGGLFALCFLLRDRGFDPSTLDIYASDASFPTLVEYFMYSPLLAPHLRFNGTTMSNHQHRVRFLVRREATFNTNSGKRIRLRESATVSACSPIGRAWTTALMNFVTETSFGCAYPRLTLNQRALISDVYESVLPPEARRMRHVLQHNGFSLQTHPAQWEDYAVQVPPPSVRPPGIFPCFRSQHLCPDQGRYFGDRGSLVGYFDPTPVAHSVARARGTPPYGPMAAWRLWVRQCCDRACIVNDPILHSSIISSPLIITDERTFHQPSDDADTMSNPRALSSIPIPVRGRGRALTI